MGKFLDHRIIWDDVQGVVEKNFHWKFSGPLYMVFWVKKKSMFD